jgi:L-lactate utilization protein LutC
MNTLASAERVQKTVDALSAHHFMPVVVNFKEEALEKIKEFIPAGASVMNGSSVTLQEVGFVDYLKSGEHGWNNLHANILAETDPQKQAQLRKESVLSDVYVGSAHALTETGEILIASNTGSQLPHIAFTSSNIILVIGANKIVPTMSDGFARIKEHVLPLEDKRMQGVYGFGTTWAKTLVLHEENPNFGRTVHVIIVNEALGY